MLQKKSLMRPDVEMGLPPTPQTRNKIVVADEVAERKNQFEHRGSRTVLKMPHDKTFLSTSFSVKDNLYGARLNTS